MKRLTKIYSGGREVLRDITLAFLPGAKIGVLGLNGAGKSTLLRIMAGLDDDVSGEAWAADGIRVGYLPQEPELDPARDVLGNVMLGVAAAKELLDRFDAVSARFAEPLDDAEMDALLAEQAELQERIDAAGGWDLQRQLDIAMDALRCPPGDADVTKLSGGERRRVALCRLLLERPDILLLDEPTNHLDALSVAWLERFLHDYPGTVVAITHDRYFLDNVAGWILELDRGRGIPWEGNYSSWLEQKQKRLALEEKQESARQRTLAHELEWIRATPTARRARNKARLNAYRQLLAERAERAPNATQIVIPQPPRPGDLVPEAEGLVKGYRDRPLPDGVSLRLPPGGAVGVTGPNGARQPRMLGRRHRHDRPTHRVPQQKRLRDSERLNQPDEIGHVIFDLIPVRRFVRKPVPAGVVENKVVVVLQLRSQGAPAQPVVSNPVSRHHHRFARPFPRPPVMNPNAVSLNKPGLPPLPQPRPARKSEHEQNE